MHHPKHRRLLLTSIALMLSACATTGDWFKSDKVKGPRIGPNNARAEVLHRCTASNGIFNIYSSNAGGSCISAFKGPSGALIEMANVRQSVDAHLRTLEDFSTWQLKSTGSSSFYRAPFSFYLLTVNPVIVLATRTPDRKYSSGCEGPMRGSPCASSSLIQEGFGWEELPIATDVAYWFAPGHTKGKTEIHLADLPLRISVPGATALIGMRDGRWYFEREK